MTAWQQANCDFAFEALENLAGIVRLAPWAHSGRAFSSALIYAPYMPLHTTPSLAPMATNSTFAGRFAKARINKKNWRKVTIRGPIVNYKYAADALRQRRKRLRVFSGASKAQAAQTRPGRVGENVKTIVEWAKHHGIKMDWGAAGPEFISEVL